MDRRRFLLTSLVGGLVMPLAVDAQSKVARIGYLSLAPGPSPRSEALRQGLHDLGYVVGTNLTIDYRWADGSLDRARQGAADLVRLKVDVIVTGGPQATLAVREATTTTPIVMAVDYDPVGAGFVASLARPGGNITGLSAINPELSGKRLDLLRQAVPRLSNVAVLWNPTEPNGQTFLGETRAAAKGSPQNKWTTGQSRRPGRRPAAPTFALRELGLHDAVHLVREAIGSGPLISPRALRDSEWSCRCWKFARRPISRRPCRPQSSGTRMA